MSHQPYETYLFTNEPLTGEERERLERHLQECERCRALATALNNLDMVTFSSAHLSPATGFSQRWHTRLSAYRQERQIRNLWLMTLGLFALASLIILTVFLINLNQVNWSYELSQFIASFGLFTARVRRSYYFLRSIIKAASFLVPFLLIFGIGTVATTLAIIITWFNTLIRLYVPINQRGNLS